MLTHRFCNWLVTFALLAVGCAHRGAFPVASDATFSAHIESRGLVLDRTRAGGVGLAEPPGWLRLPGQPAAVVRIGDMTAGWVWVDGPAGATVRREQSADMPVVATVRSAWQDNVISLTLDAGGAGTFTTTTFARQGGTGGPEAISRAAQTVLEVRGEFRAEVRDAGGAPVGWLRARITPYQSATRVYDGVLPPAIDDALAAAAALVLDAEVTWIENHAIDVYRGTGSSGPLERSFPR
jgi:hypothetical protein